MITQKPVTLFWNSLPRSKMNFIDANRFFLPLLGLPFFNPFIVAPFEALKVEDQRRGLNSVLSEKSARIALQHQLTKAIPYLELIVNPFNNSRNKQLPDSSLDSLSHRMSSSIPSVE